MPESPESSHRPLATVVLAGCLLASPALVAPALAALLAGTTCTAAGGTGCPAAIPALSPGVVTSTLEITGCDQISDVDVGLQVQHDWTGDLRVLLESPTGTRVRLLDRPVDTGSAVATTFGCAFDDVDAVLDDEAATEAATACEDDLGGTQAAIRGSLRPAELLSAFDGLLGNGTWRLYVSDFAGDDAGTLDDWSLQLTCIDVDVDLRTIKTANLDSAGIGQEVDFLLGVGNVGSATASGVVVTDDLPAGLAFVSSDCATLDAPLASASTVRWRVGDLEPGERTQCLVTTQVDGSVSGLIENTIDAVAAQSDALPSDNQATAQVTSGLFFDDLETGNLSRWSSVAFGGAP